MKVKVITETMLRSAIFSGALINFTIGVAGCAMHEPLREGHLKTQAKDPRISTVLLHFKTRRLPPSKGISESINRVNLRWIFAVANESTGWNFRRLDEFSIFKTKDASIEADPGSVDSGWVTFLATPGLNYIAVTSYATGLGFGGLDLVATPFPDRISVGHSAGRLKELSGFPLATIDFLDTPRFTVQVSGPQSVVYAGTIVRTIKCDETESVSSTCPYDLTVDDESGFARTFVSRYLKDFIVASRMQTQLLTIPQSRTIRIRSSDHNRDHPRQ